MPTAANTAASDSQPMMPGAPTIPTTTAGPTAWTASLAAAAPWYLPVCRGFIKARDRPHRWNAAMQNELRNAISPESQVGAAVALRTHRGMPVVSRAQGGRSPA